MAAGVEGLKGFSCIILVFYHEGSGIVNDPRDAELVCRIPQIHRCVLLCCMRSRLWRRFPGIQLFMQIQYSRLLFGRLSFSLFGCFSLNLIYEG